MKVDDEYRIRDQQNLADIQHLASRARLRVVGCDSIDVRTGGVLICAIC